MATAGQDVVGLLGRVPVFETLAPDDLERVAQVAVSRRFPNGQVIFREGDESDTCYVVHHGHARALRVLEVVFGVLLVALAVVGPFAVLALLVLAGRRLVVRRRREAALG